MNKSKKEVLKDWSIYGVYIEKDGKRIDPEDFYKMELSNCCNAPVYKIDKLTETFCVSCHLPCDIGGKSFKEEKEATD